LLLLLLGLSQGDRSGLISWDVGLPVLGSAALLAVFVWWERRSSSPMVDLRLFESSAFSAGVSAATLAYLALFAVTFTLPFYLMRVKGLDARVAGLVLTTTPIAMAVLAPIAGRASDRMGSRGLATGGILGLSAGLLVGSFLVPASSLWQVIGTLLLVGGGMAVFQTPNTSAILRATPRWATGVGSAFVSVARNVGMAIGIALTAAIVGASLGGEGLPAGASTVPEQVAEAFVDGMSTAMRVAAGLALVGAAISWFGRNGGSVEPTDGTH
jgi:predicted MFS family arabinose efflux permease